MNPLVARPSADPPPLILLPGMQCTAILFGSLLAALPPTTAETRVLAVTADDLASAVSDVVEVAAALVARGTGPVVLVGHSLGANVAMATARDRPDLIGGLVCLCANPRRPTEQQQDGWRALRADLETPDAGAWSVLTESTLTAWHGEPAPGEDPSIRRRSRQMIEDTGPAGLRAQLGVQLTRVDERPGLDAFAGPVLAVAGGRDTVVPPDRTREIADRDRGRYVVVADGDHLAPMTAARATADALTAWWGSWSSTTRPDAAPRT